MDLGVRMAHKRQLIWFQFITSSIAQLRSRTVKDQSCQRNILYSSNCSCLSRTMCSSFLPQLLEEFNVRSLSSLSLPNFNSVMTFRCHPFLCRVDIRFEVILQVGVTHSSLDFKAFAVTATRWCYEGEVTPHRISSVPATSVLLWKLRIIQSHYPPP